MCAGRNRGPRRRNNTKDQNFKVIGFHEEEAGEVETRKKRGRKLSRIFSLE